MIWASAGVAAMNLITTSTSSAWPPPGIGRKPHVPYTLQLPRSPPLDRLQVRTAKHAVCEPENDVGAQPPGSPHTPVAVMHVPYAWPGPSKPQVATVSGMPLFGSSRSAEAMSLVSDMAPLPVPARAAPAASIDCQ